MRSLAFKETAFELRSGSLASIGEITTRACSYRAGVSRTIGRFFCPERAAEIVLHFNNRMDTNRTISLGNSRFMPKPNKQIFSRARFGRNPNRGLHVFPDRSGSRSSRSLASLPTSVASLNPFSSCLCPSVGRSCAASASLPRETRNEYCERPKSGCCSRQISLPSQGHLRRRSS